MNLINKQKHKTILIEILKEIYSDPKLKKVLGFKGGTAAYLFYDLPRLSVDLDFDLLKEVDKKMVLDKLADILKEFGQIDDQIEKHYTIFLLLNYQKGHRNIKIEVSKRPTVANFKKENYLGIPVLVIAKPDMAAGKLSALISRKKLASRDLFDLWFFLKNDWRIREAVVKEKTDLTLKQALNKALKITKQVPKRRLLQGMGELLKEDQKSFVRNKLKKELSFQIKLYLESLE